MKKRDSFSDLGLVICVSIFLCVLIKSLLFGFTWGGIVWLALSGVYFFISMKYDSHSKVVRRSTAAYLLVSLLAIVVVAMFDKKAMPKMHAFEGTGDTIRDEQVEDMGIEVPMYETLSIDTTIVESDTLSDVAADSLLMADSVEVKIEESPMDSTFN